MAIIPISGASALTPIAPIPVEPSRPGSRGRSDAATPGDMAAGAQDPAAGPLPQRSAQAVQELKDVASHAGLEVKFVTLPDSSATLLRLVDPTTGRVMREFPPEGVAIALAELKARASSHQARPVLDHQA
jgi:FlaG protein